ncbi:MAG: heavy metal translocating P-type ATPase [Myxococcales bacterium]|nr:heavy metal translocating P-type ATPase [Myxococcales bacterium]
MTTEPDTSTAADVAPPAAFTFGVRGMTCAVCATRVERVSRKIPGIDAAVVNLALERLEITAHPGDDTFTALSDALTDAGYELVRGAEPDELRENQAQARAHELQQWTRHMRVALLLAAPVVVVSMAMMLVPAWQHLHHNPWISWAIWIPATLVQFGPGRVFYRSAWHALRSGSADMNVLVVLGSTVAWGWSTLAMLVPSWHTMSFVESSASVIALVLFGKWLEMRARARAGDAVQRLLDMRPRQVTLLRGDQQRQVDARDLLVGDRVLVRVGERMPVDGVIVDTTTAVDESMLTGEAMPVTRAPGQTVTGGTMNVGAPVQVRAMRVGSSTTLAQLIRLVEHAQASRPPIQQQLDRVVAVFVPIVLLVALATFVGWYFVGGLYDAIYHAVTVLVVACPCAMGLATPISLFVATSRAAQSGMVFRQAAAIQNLAGVDTVVFDKTGTLTVGHMQVSDVTLFEHGLDLGRQQTLALIASAEQGSEHTLGRAVVAHARAHGWTLSAMTRTEVLPGRGLVASSPPYIVRVGSREWLQDLGVDAEAFGAAAGEGSSGSGLVVESSAATRDGRYGPGTVVYAAIEFVNAAEVGESPGNRSPLRLAAAIFFADELRAEAATTVSALQAMGCRVEILSGDSAKAVSHVAALTGADGFTARVLPGGKVDVLNALRAAGRKVLFVGDGLNDAPALAAADVGIAMGSASDIAMDAGDVVLLNDRVAAIREGILLARATMRNIGWNLVWAFGYNIALIPAAAGLLTGISPWLAPSPMLAAGAMSVSSVFVVSNALRLRRVRLG